MRDSSPLTWLNPRCLIRTNQANSKNGNLTISLVKKIIIANPREGIDSIRSNRYDQCYYRYTYAENTWAEILDFVALVFSRPPPPTYRRFRARTTLLVFYFPSMYIKSTLPFYQKMFTTDLLLKCSFILKPLAHWAPREDGPAFALYSQGFLVLLPHKPPFVVK